ncbi:SDR family NAD(P)-dependent oxidoreductase [Streptomyces sp. NPDC003660]
MTKKVLITGGATGFGRGVAATLAAEEGWEVVVGCENWQQVTDVRNGDDLKGAVSKVTAVKLDVTDPIDRAKAFAEHEPDVLVLNHAIMESGAVIETPPGIFEKIFDVNVLTGIRLLQGFGRKMVERGSGRIIWVSSQAGLNPVPWDAPYGMSKFAVEALAAAAYEELKPHGVQVCTINPGAFKTGFNDTGLESMKQWREQAEYRLPTEPFVGWLDHQADPAIMIEGMVEAIKAEHPKYRTFLPTEQLAYARNAQNELWDRVL